MSEEHTNSIVDQLKSLQDSEWTEGREESRGGEGGGADVLLCPCDLHKKSSDFVLYKEFGCAGKCAKLICLLSILYISGRGQEDWFFLFVFSKDKAITKSGKLPHLSIKSNIRIMWFYQTDVLENFISIHSELCGEKK